MNCLVMWEMGDWGRVWGERTCLSIMVITGATRIEAQNAAVRSEATRQGRLRVLWLLCSSELNMAGFAGAAEIRTLSGGLSMLLAEERIGKFDQVSVLANTSLELYAK